MKTMFLSPLTSHRLSLSKKKPILTVIHAEIRVPPKAMAANRFATMLHINTNKFTLILTYALLEWILIVLLMLNSLFSYLILKFAEFFGLRPPCPWCTRVDHLFDPAKGGTNMSRDILCELHSKGISELGFCSNHRKLVDSREMCGNCFSSRPEMEVSPTNSASMNCSCCGVSLGKRKDGDDDDKYSSYILLKTSSWDAVLECAQKQNLITGIRYGEVVSDFSADLWCNDNGNVLENQMISEFEGNSEKETEVNGFIHATGNASKELEKEILKEENLDLVPKNDTLQIFPQHLEFFVDHSGHKLVPAELIDLVTGEHKIEEDDVTKDQEVGVDSEVQVEVKEEIVVVESMIKIENTFHDFDLNEEPKYERPDSMKTEEDGSSLFFQAKGSHLETDVFEHLGDFPLAQWPSEEAGEVPEPKEMEMHSDIQTASEEASQGNNENKADVSIGTEIPDLDIADEIQILDSNHSYEPIQEDPSTNSAILSAVNDHGPIQVEEQNAEAQSLSVHDRDNITNNDPSVQMELKETEEDTVPDTPTSMESLNLDKNFLLFEKRYCGTEESLDESVISELDSGDGVVTIERLKTALRSERKNLQALYTELEEERSASAVATNQTMTMINRLQEEKAAMQMEALQYQRMMEEQSEYDQEALQLLNGIMVKREKEKQELERELEAYRKKLFDYDIKEKAPVLSKSREGSFRSGFSSASSSNADDSDGLSVDLNQEVKEEDVVYGNSDYTSHNTPVDAVVNLEESLADFEEERLSILEQLKVLEEKILMLDYETEQSFEDVKKIDENGDHFYAESNGYSNGNHNYKRITGQKGKLLLPLLDAISDENDDLMMVNGNRFETEGRKKVAIEEEVDHLYERLQALEADREFLKHCISSLKKGDKGMYLLQEILQHLRDLRSVELRVRNIGDSGVI